MILNPDWGCHKVCRLQGDELLGFFLYFRLFVVGSDDFFDQFVADHILFVEMDQAEPFNIF